MLAPGLLATLAPAAIGFSAKLLGALTNQDMLGPTVVAAFLMSATITGIVLGLFLNNAGGAWDNAKKYIESGAHGGKNSLVTCF